VLDGAMGTMIQGLAIGRGRVAARASRDFHRDVRGNNDLLILTQPQAIEDIHHAYLKAGVPTSSPPTPSPRPRSRKPTTTWRTRL